MSFLDQAQESWACCRALLDCLQKFIFPFEIGWVFDSSLVCYRLEHFLMLSLKLNLFSSNFLSLLFPFPLQSCLKEFMLKLHRLVELILMLSFHWASLLFSISSVVDHFADTEIIKLLNYQSLFILLFAHCIFFGKKLGRHTTYLRDCLVIIDLLSLDGGIDLKARVNKLP